MISEKHLIELRKIFLDEADDLFIKIEENLLALEKSPDDKSLIAAIFRSIHTLKGSSGMIGSQKVTDFVHNLETIFDHVRAEQLPLTPDIVDCTLQSMDHIKQIILNPELTDPKDLENDKRLTEQISNILADSVEWGTSSNGLKPTETTDEPTTFHIVFKPAKDIFANGTKPLLLIEELADLGETKVYAHIDLDDKAFDPANCYTSWNVILATVHTKASISDVFIFLEDHHQVEINFLAHGNLLQNPEFVSRLPENNLSREVIGFTDLESIIKDMEPKTDDQHDPKPQEESKESTPSTASSFKKERSISSIRVSSDKLDQLMNHVSELVTTQAGLSLYAKNNFDPTLDAIADNIEKLARQLRDITFEMTLIEIENLFARFHRSVRDIASQLNKSINFITEGGETELDKTIIESLADPLLHLIRNSLDHGIETREERVLLGKPEKGTIKLKSFHSGAKVYIQIADDGKGIDPEYIREKAIKKGLILKEDNLSDSEIFDLIFVAGFSTVENITDLSGRGVGMDVVRKNVQDMRGEIKVESVIDQGTTITIGLPLTLSVIDGLQVLVADTNYIIPLSSVVKCFEMHRAALLNDFNHVVDLDGTQQAYIDLRREFKLADETAPEFSSVILVQNGDSQVGICVDEIVGEYQAVLKPVGKYYRNQAFVSGATILGDGTIALVLDTNNLISLKNNSLKKIST